MESNNEPIPQPDAPISPPTHEVEPKPVDQNGTDLRLAFQIIFLALYDTFSELNLVDWNETLQISLAGFLCALILFTCLYRRNKIAKSAMTTL